MNKALEPSLDPLYERIRSLIAEGRRRAAVAVNFATVETYWQIGREIVEEEQGGSDRAAYGKYILKEMSKRLSAEFGGGFDESNLRYIRQFYKAFPIRDAVRHELTWTHYRILSRVENPLARNFYISEAIECQWDTRLLQRQVNTLYYERILSSRERKELREEEGMGKRVLQPEDILKDPYILDFLGLKTFPKLSESDLEQALIDKLQEFLLELGKGFAFIARQQRIRAETKDRFIDLVFYNILLKCYVLIDLKVGELDHADISQMDMYVRMYEDKVRRHDDNPTIGLILCTEKDATVVRYSILEESKQLFASKYKLYLPSEEELATELARELELIARERGTDDENRASSNENTDGG
jgi:predicted nuclease of restriction endonuclease-like (RecB) superfamily